MPSCPTGRGALAALPELMHDPYQASQPSVEGLRVESMMRLMQSNHWDWQGREIKYNDGVIVDGHHRYIAARLSGVEPVLVPDEAPYYRVFGWDELFVGSRPISGGY